METKYFITYERNTVWGTGKTERESKLDANINIYDWYNTKCNEEPKIAKSAILDMAITRVRVRTVRCSRELYKWLEVYGGAHVPFTIYEGVAHLTKL